MYWGTNRSYPVAEQVNTGIPVLHNLVFRSIKQSVADPTNSFAAVQIRRWITDGGVNDEAIDMVSNDGRLSVVSSSPVVLCWLQWAYDAAHTVPSASR